VHHGGGTSLLSSLSSLSSSKSSATSGEITESEDEGSWADLLGSDWQDQKIQSVGSDTSLGSDPGNSDNSEFLSLDDHGFDSSSSSGYSGDEDLEFDSDMLEVSDHGDDSEIEGFSTVDCWGWLRRWVQQ